MAKVLSSAWAVLAGLYRLPGQASSPPGLELALPAQTVHDLSREAEVARQTTFEFTYAQIAAAGATDRTAFNRQALFLQASTRAAVQRLGFDPTTVLGNELDVWVERVVGHLDAASTPANLSVAMAGVIQQGQEYDGVTHYVTYRSNLADTVPLAAAGDFGLSAGGLDPRAPWDLAYPFRLGPGVGSSLESLVSAGGAGGVTVNWSWLLRLVPRLVRPLGLA